MKDKRVFQRWSSLDVSKQYDEIQSKIKEIIEISQTQCSLHKIENSGGWLQWPDWLRKLTMNLVSLLLMGEQIGVTNTTFSDLWCNRATVNNPYKRESSSNVSKVSPTFAAPYMNRAISECITLKSVQFITADILHS